jgi:hypothetical protein
VRNPPAAPLARLSSHGSNCPVPVLDCAGGSWMERDRPRPRGRSVGMRKTADRERGCARVDRLWRGKIDRGCQRLRARLRPVRKRWRSDGCGQMAGWHSAGISVDYFFRLCMARSMNPSPSATCARTGFTRWPFPAATLDRRSLRTAHQRAARDTLPLRHIQCHPEQAKHCMGARFLAVGLRPCVDLLGKFEREPDRYHRVFTCRRQAARFTLYGF